MPEVHIRQANTHLVGRLEINNHLLIGECRFTIFFVNYPLADNLLRQVEVILCGIVIVLAARCQHCCAAESQDGG